MQIHEMPGELGLRLLVLDPLTPDKQPVYDFGQSFNGASDVMIMDAESPVAFIPQPPNESRVTLKMFDATKYNPEEAMTKFFATVFGMILGDKAFKVKHAPHHHRKLVCSKNFQKSHLYNFKCSCSTILTPEWFCDNDLIGCMDAEYTGVFAATENTFGACVRLGSFTAYHVI